MWKESDISVGTICCPQSTQGSHRGCRREIIKITSRFDWSPLEFNAAWLLTDWSPLEFWQPITEHSTITFYRIFSARLFIIFRIWNEVALSHRASEWKMTGIMFLPFTISKSDNQLRSCKQIVIHLIHFHEYANFEFARRRRIRTEFLCELRIRFILDGIWFFRSASTDGIRCVRL